MQNVDIQQKIKMIDERIVKLRRISNEYCDKHGVQHSGMMTLIVALMEEKEKYLSSLKGVVIRINIFMINL